MAKDLDSYAQALVDLNKGSDIPAPARARLLFQAFLALVTSVKGSPLTSSEVARVCAEETRRAVDIGRVDTRQPGATS